MLEIKNINKSYNNQAIIKDLSYNFTNNHIYAITGPSGCGKSTLLKTFNGLEAIDSGEILFNNQPLTPSNIYNLRPKIGMIFQNFNLFTNMNVLENVASGLIYVLNYSKNYAQQESIKIIDKVGLSHRKEAQVNELSGGEKQRVAIARTMVMNPEIILCDEPTSALDQQSVKQFSEIIANFIEHQKLAIIVTHELDFAKDVADIVLKLDSGKLIY